MKVSVEGGALRGPSRSHPRLSVLSVALWCLVRSDFCSSAEGGIGKVSPDLRGPPAVSASWFLC